jgi:two-component system LytT family sensor kinase
MLAIQESPQSSADTASSAIQRETRASPVTARKRVEGFRLKLREAIKARSKPLIMHPAIFVGGFVFLGQLFALQEWITERLWNYKLDIGLLARAWAVQYFLWGVLCWLLWLGLGPKIQHASLRWIFGWLIPLSIFVCVGEEAIWVICFPNLPLSHEHMSFLHRLTFQLDAELIYSLGIFWCAVALFRGIGYYEKYREKEQAAAQLAVQLAHAQLRALRMQLNPHFLFNTMNSISSLMQIDVASADTMLEQLGSLLRITLERGEAQLIPLSDEMEFCEVYLALQDRRFAGRVRREVHVEHALHDALVPAMLLQPIIENAYAHGLSRLDRDGLLVIDVRRGGGRMKLSVSNNGGGLNPDFQHRPAGRGVGLTNVQDRLRLHYGKAQYFSIRETAPGKVEVSIALPLQFSTSPTESLTGYGA